MGIDYSAAYADVIQLEDVQKLCPVEYDALMGLLEKINVSFDDFASAFARDMVEDDIILPNLDDDEQKPFQEELLDALETLMSAFKRVTATEDGYLYLTLEHHASDGNRADEITGGFFNVGGVYKKTPAGERFQDIIQRKFFVVIG